MAGAVSDVHGTLPKLLEAWMHAIATIELEAAQRAGEPEGRRQHCTAVHVESDEVSPAF